MSPRLAAFARALRAFLGRPRIVLWATAFAAVLAVPALFEGLEADDHVIRSLLLRIPPWDAWARPPLELFSFFDGDHARCAALVDHGFSPWWTDPDLRIMFFRPLSAFTHWVDFRLWPAWPALMHLHSVAFYLALVAAAGALYRRILGPGWVAGLAAVMYAVDHNHGVLIEWIANRNALVAGLFAVLSLLLHDVARRSGKPLVSVASAACLGLGLLGGEVAVGIAGYLLAYALFLDDARPRARLASLAPHLVVLAAWLLAYRLGGFGAHGSDMYIDPVRSPVAFLGAAVTHVPLLLFGELGGAPSDILVFVQSPSPAIYVGAALVAGIALAGMAKALRDRRARFFLAGALLATVPSVATFPAGRLMLLPGLGLLGVVALVVEGMVDRLWTFGSRPARWAALFTAVVVGGGHLFVSPITLEGASHQMIVLEGIVARYGDALTEEPELARQRVVLVNPPDAFFSYYMLTQRLTAGRVAPEKLLALASGVRALSLDRPDASTLVVRCDGGFFRYGPELLTRSLSTPMPAGTRVALVGVTIEVTRAGTDGVPTEATFRFDHPLEDPGLRWLEWRGPTLVPFTLPAVGEHRSIEAQTPSF